MTAPNYLAPYVRSFFEDHLICRRNASAHTVQSYRDGVKLLLLFASKRLKKSATKLLVRDLTDTVILAFLTDLEQTRGNAIQTRNHRLVGIQCLFEYIAVREPLFLDHCHRVGIIPKKRGAKTPEIRYLEKDQVAAILKAIPNDRSVGRRDYALLSFMYNTGARVQEVADTRISWLTLTPTFKVQLLGKGRKWRTCPLWDSTASHLRQQIEERGATANQDDHLFLNRYGRPLSRSGITNIVQRYSARAGKTMPSLKALRVTPHTFRHTTAMHLLQSGVELNVIRSWLGHVSIATTNKYIEIDLAMKTKALETCKLQQNDKQLAWQPSADILAWLESL